VNEILEWRDVDLHERVIRLRAEVSKNAEGRVLPLEGPLWELIEHRLDAGDGPYVFHRQGKPIGDFRKAWIAACVKAGMYKEVEDTQGKKKIIPTKIVHDFRRTAAREMVRARSRRG
jgi:integrase